MNVVVFFIFLTAALLAQADPTFHKTISQDTKEQILQDLTFVKSITGKSSSNFYKAIFQKEQLNDLELAAFFDQRINSFRAHDCGGGNAVAACVIPSMSSSTMWITPNYVKNNLPQIYRLSLMFHESRHTETKKWQLDPRSVSHSLCR